MKKAINIFNLIMLIAIVIADICYNLIGTLLAKSIASSLFVLLGLVNLIYVIKNKTQYLKFSIILFIGLIFAMLGDIVLQLHFISGAILFAIGHILFFCAYCTIIRFKPKDLLYGLAIFIPVLALILFLPIFDFGDIVMKLVCIIYALIISAMTSKAISNYLQDKSLLNLIVLIGSSLFIFSDFMLLFDVFSELSSVFGILCLATYYPAEFLLAHSIMSTTIKLNN